MKRLQQFLPARFDFKLSLISLAVFLVLAAIFGTFIGLNAVDPRNPISPVILVILGGNAILLLVLSAQFLSRYGKIKGGALLGKRGGLTRRFVLQFSAAAILPSSIVALLLLANVFTGIENWFSARVEGAINQAVEVAKDNIEALNVELDSQVQAMVVDVDNAHDGFVYDKALFQTYFDRQIQARNFTMAWIFDENSDVILAKANGNAMPFPSINSDVFAEARAGRIPKTLFEEAGAVLGLAKLNAFDSDVFLLVLARIDPQYLSNLRGLGESNADLVRAKENARRLYVVFGIGYFQIAILLLVSGCLLALEAAEQITSPIQELAKAAHSVGKGNLSAHVTLPKQRDEVYTLSRSFNAMTRQLADQRSELEVAQDELSQRNDFLEALLTAINAGVIRVDMNGFIDTANPSARALLRLIGRAEEEEIEGKALGQMAPDLAQIVGLTLATSTDIDQSLEIDRPDGNIHLRVKTAKDRFDGCIVTIDDLTRLVIAQRHVAWRDVARRIAHEIRNPLTPIQLSAERLNRRFGDLEALKQDDVFENCIATILRKVDELGGLVENFSAFATMPEPLRQRFDLQALLENSVFAHNIIFPDIEFDLQTHLAQPHYIGDDRLLGQAFGNLLTNAGQAIKLYADQQEDDAQKIVSIVATASSEVDGIILRFIDNGPGFPTENAEDLFKPYVTHNPEGTGLGLSIVRRIIADHGGTVKLYNLSGDDRGACVELFLPHSDSA